MRLVMDITLDGLSQRDLSRDAFININDTSPH